MEWLKRIGRRIHAFVDSVENIPDTIRAALSELFSNRIYYLTLVLQYCRFSILAVIVGSGVILLTGQGRELTVRLQGDFWRQILFILACFTWAWQSWYWSRLILDSRQHYLLQLVEADKDAQVFVRFLVRYVPRSVGFVAFAVMAAAAMINGLYVTGVALFLLGGASMWFWHVRRQLLESSEETPRIQTVGRVVRFGSYLLLLVVFVIALATPVWTGFALGSAAIVLFALASIVIVGSLAVYATSERGFPVVTMLVIWAGLFSAIGVTDNHQVRALPKGSLAARENVIAAYDSWRVNDGPLVLVATAGGGIRAAFWTATVLGALDDAIPGFSNHVFAISGVSGGSLGAAVYAVNSTARCDVGAESTSNEACMQAALFADFLGPTVTSMLYGDLINRFLPFNFTDRAAALEVGWETIARETYGEDVLTQSFTGLTQAAGWVPRLLLNGTHEETGRRIITSHFEIDPVIFGDAFDFYDFHPQGTDVRVSTAALNSARFSYVSPAGTLTPAGHILDGGYFSNYGAKTLQELLDYLHEKFATDLSGRAIVVIQITNAGTDVDQIKTSEPQGRDKSTKLLNEVRAPVIGLMEARSARGLLSAKELEQQLKSLPKSRQSRAYVHFRLSSDVKPRIPLGWTLAMDSDCGMQRQLRDDNEAAFHTVVQVFGSNLKGLRPVSEHCR